MKQRLGGLILASFLAASCAAPLSGPAPSSGTLKLSLDGLYSSGFRVQALQSGTQAKVTVTGAGLDKPLTLTAPISGASMVATLTGIPVGPNRVIEVESLDGDGAPIPGARFRTSATLQEGANTAAISATTTPRGDAFAKLLADGSDLAKSLDADKLQAKIEEIQRSQRVPHFGLIDGAHLAEALKANGGNIAALSAFDPAFVQAPKTQRLVVMGVPEALQAEVWVNDPVSPKQSGLSNGGLDITPIKPGAWQIFGRAGSLRVGPVPVAFDRPIVLDFSQSFPALAAMPVGRGGAASAVLRIDGQERLVVAGGVAGSDANPQVTGSVEAFDGETWTSDLPAMPTPVSHAAYASKDNRLWVLGGFTVGGARTNEIQCFDATAKAWTTPATLNYPSSNASAGFIGNDLYMTAGMEYWYSADQGKYVTVPNSWIYKLDPVSNTVTALSALDDPELMYPRYGTATAVADGKLFVISGQDSLGPLHSVEVLDLSKGTKGSVRAIAPIPTPRFGASAWVSGGKIVVAGGVTAMGKPQNAVEAYDLATGRWDVLSPLRMPRSYAATGMLNGKRLIAGGHDGYFIPPTLNVLPLGSVETLSH